MCSSGGEDSTDNLFSLRTTQTYLMTPSTVCNHGNTVQLNSLAVATATHCCVATGNVEHQLLQHCSFVVLAFEDEGKEPPHQREGGHVTEEGGEVQGGEEHGLRSLLW